MTFFDEVFSKLLGKKNNPKVPLVNEPLIRNDAEQTRYQKWLAAGAHQDLIENLADACHKKKLGIISELEVHLLDTRYSNGFALSYHDSIGKEEFSFLFDYFKQSTLTMDYKLAQGDRRIIDKGDYEETIEKWYLKPDVKHSGKEFEDQIYGNVLIEHYTIDRKPSYLKLMVNVYQGRPFAEPRSFDEYLEKLFNTDQLHD